MFSFDFATYRESSIIKYLDGLHFDIKMNSDVKKRLSKNLVIGGCLSGIKYFADNRTKIFSAKMRIPSAPDSKVCTDEKSITFKSIENSEWKLYLKIRKFFTERNFIIKNDDSRSSSNSVSLFSDRLEANGQLYFYKEVSSEKESYVSCDERSFDLKEDAWRSEERRVGKIGMV